MRYIVSLECCFGRNGTDWNGFIYSWSVVAYKNLHENGSLLPYEKPTPTPDRLLLFWMGSHTPIGPCRQYNQR